ncbi:MAG: hypothetical protein E6J99_05205 [Methanobacteriota archaeon]|nr:MAG: hypothetical protein E6J99_05205 [Euryarchaeota archaeon]
MAPMARNGADQGCGQEELESIGRVMVRFSFLEFLLKMWIWGLLNTPPQKGVIATGKMRFNETLELLDALYRHQEGILSSNIRQLRKLEKKLGRLNDRRNLLVHGIHAHMGEGGKLMVADTRLKRSLEFIPTVSRFSLKDINQLADDIAANSDEVRKQVTSAGYISALRGQEK